MIELLLFLIFLAIMLRSDDGTGIELERIRRILQQNLPQKGISAADDLYRELQRLDNPSEPERKFRKRIKQILNREAR